MKSLAGTSKRRFTVSQAKTCSGGGLALCFSSALFFDAGPSLCYSVYLEFDQFGDCPQAPLQGYQRPLIPGVRARVGVVKTDALQLMS